MQHLGAKAEAVHPSRARSFYGLLSNKVRTYSNPNMKYNGVSSRLAVESSPGDQSSDVGRSPRVSCISQLICGDDTDVELLELRA